jgi:hypothetical protein
MKKLFFLSSFIFTSLFSISASSQTEFVMIFETKNISASQDLYVEPAPHLPSCATWNPTTDVTAAHGQSSSPVYSTLVFTCDVSGSFMIHNASGGKNCSINFNCKGNNGSCSIPSSTNNVLECTYTQPAPNGNALQSTITANLKD